MTSILVKYGIYCTDTMSGIRGRTAKFWMTYCHLIDMYLLTSNSTISRITEENLTHVVRRTIKLVLLDNTENLVDSRNNSDMHKNGHDHNSICGPLLFLTTTNNHNQQPQQKRTKNHSFRLRQNLLFLPEIITKLWLFQRCKEKNTIMK